MDIKKLLISLGLIFSALNISSTVNAEIVLTPQWTERYLFKHYPYLLKNSHTDHVLAFYYFGGFKDFTIMGMERVKGDDYQPYNTVLIFKDSELQGYYEELAVFPAGVNKLGVVKFPGNNDVVENIDLEKVFYPEIVFSREKKLFPNDFTSRKYTDLD